MGESWEVRPIQARELTHGGSVLASAFQQDPLFQFVVPHEAQRQRWLPVFEREVLRRSQPWGHNVAVVDAEGRMLGAMAVTPPGRYPTAWWREWRLLAISVLLPTPWCPSLIDVWPLRRYAETFHEMHYAGPHWYLDVIGVHAAHQRRGVGRLLLERVIDWSEASGDPVWLETQTAENVGYYESFGFEVTAQHHPVPAGPPTWGMLRPRRAAL